jgi:flagellar assembly factor FliW
MNFHLNTSNDLEVYTIENVSKDRLEEICNLKQPVLFNYDNENLFDLLNISKMEELYGAFDVKVRNIVDKDSESEIYLPVILNEVVKIFQNKNNNKIIIENNQDFLEETGLLKTFRYNDSFLRPPLVSICKYDFMSGSEESFTPLRYNISHRNYYLVTGGEVHIKLVPPSNGKYLQKETDYDIFEFSSPINPWEVQEKYKPEFDKVKVLDLHLKKGQIIQIPPYWWYSIKYKKVSSICVFKYRTYMSTVSILPKLLLGLLQQQNIKRVIADKINFDKNDILNN